jgi:hypothetical protein
LGAAELSGEIIVTSTTTSLIAFGVIFGCSLLGMVIRVIVPERHFTNEARDVLRLALGLVTTLNALVLGLLVSTAKSSYDARRSQLTEIAADVILADHSLALYGPETNSARNALRDQVGALVDQIRSRDVRSTKLQLPRKADWSDFYQMVWRLSPSDDGQKLRKAEVLRLSLEVAQIRASALARESSSIPTVFLVILVFWLAVLFLGFGFLTSRNLMVAGALCVCALIVSTAVYLILDMDQPFTGFMELSIEPLRNAAAVISGSLPTMN